MGVVTEVLTASRPLPLLASQVSELFLLFENELTGVFFVFNRHAIPRSSHCSLLPSVVVVKMVGWVAADPHAASVRGMKGRVWLV